ncbi:hypothetical protein G7Y89_g7299 [Cudoniella acicularis]|uniref:Saccharopine dehydrogenase NADP binding domain-containing protein n=1 Tax=Cudoniella acicularis TaxID=354080 RepID=A0A8H4RLH1_9HELO|nr:hypothetical protein G7Y89_g7299 [Cudoniella acicularis]
MLGREYDLVVFGTTGFTGKLTAEYIATGLPTDLKWAIAGRSQAKLEAVAAECKTLNPDRTQPAIEMCSLEAEELNALAKKSTLLISTVGPYSLYGEHAFKACADNGTHYLDITGEAVWVSSMIKKYERTAKASGSIMIPQIGIDSAPADLVTWSICGMIREKFSAPTAEVIMAVTLDSAPSGGTIGSVLSILDVYSVKELNEASSPFALSPIPGPKVKSAVPWTTRLFGVRAVPDLGVLTTYIFEAADRPLVQRTWGLLGGPNFYGPNFQFNEYLKTRNHLTAVLTHIAMVVGSIFLLVPFLRTFLKTQVVQPGDGPSKEQAKKGKVVFQAIGTPDVASPNPPRAVCKALYRGGAYESYQSIEISIPPAAALDVGQKRARLHGSNNPSRYALYESISENYKKGLFDSPLRQCSTEAILNKNVEAFYTREHLEDILELKLLKRGASIAKNPRNLTRPRTQNPNPSDETSHTNGEAGSDGISSTNSNFLTAEEKVLSRKECAALDRESAGTLDGLTKDLVVVLATCAMGAVVQGWSQESIVGANLDWPLEFGLATKSQDGTFVPSSYNALLYFGLVNAMPYFAASVLGAWVSDPITNYHGRRLALLFAGVCSFAGPIGAAGCHSWWQLLICRFVQGVGMGAKSSVSPRWLMKKGRYGEAYLALERLRETPLQAARDLYLIYAQLKVETLLFSGETITEADLNKLLKGDENIENDGTRTARPGFFGRVAQLFTIRRNRRAVVASCIAMSAQQFSGFNVFAFLATSLFVNSGVGNLSNLGVTIGFTAANVLFSASAYLLIDKWGRRTLLLSSLTLMFPFLLLTGHFLDMDINGVPPLASVIPLLILYTALYSPGAGVIPFMYSSEVFPLVHREAGMSLACAVNFGFAGILALVTPLYSTALNHKYLKLLGAFAGFDAIAAIMVWLFMRSPSEAVSLEEMNYCFGAPTGRYMDYQVSVALPWTLKQPLRLFGITVTKKPEFAEWYHDAAENAAHAAA